MMENGRQILVYMLEGNEILYDEGGSSLEVAIANYTGKNIDYICNELRCDIVMKDEENL